MRRPLRLLLLVVAAVAVGQLLVRGASPPTSAGGPAPALVLPDLRGGTVDLAALRGRVVVVNFWATWCAPCRQELPDLAAVWTAQRGRCFELLGVVEESARDDVEALAGRIPYPVLTDPRAAAAAAWRVAGYPHTFLVDAEGQLRQAFAGPVGRGQLEAAIERLLPASCPAR